MGSSFFSPQTRPLFDCVVVHIAEVAAGPDSVWGLRKCKKWEVIVFLPFAHSTSSLSLLAAAAVADSVGELG